MVAANSCLGFAVDCGVMWKGIGVVVMGLIIFVGSIYLVLTFVLGRWMGYLVLMVAFSGWMIIQSTLWLTGFWISQGPTTPKNQGPRGSEPAWVALEASTGTTSDAYATFSSYPGQPWTEPTAAQDADIQSASSAVTTFLAEQSNAELGLSLDDPTAIQGTQFAVDSIRFATNDDGTKLAVVTSHFTGGGPLWTVSLYFDPGSVPRYSIMFLAGSLILFLIHLPLLDRAEKKRKEFLTGGGAPAWYGPA
jgi:hypothetical protein